MKNIHLLFICLNLVAAPLFAQVRPQASFKFAPGGLLLGNIGLQGEYNFGRRSITAKIGIPLKAHRTLTYAGSDADFYMKSTSFLAGYRNYLSRKNMRGFYLEPFFKFVHQSSDGTGRSSVDGQTVYLDFTNEYNAAGIGLQLGSQFIIRKKLVIDLFFLGPEINSARNNFKANETSGYLPWTPIDAYEIERDVRAFIDKFPFVRERTQITVDEANRSVSANFRGALPGIRAGVAIGIVF